MFVSPLNRAINLLIQQKNYLLLKIDNDKNNKKTLPEVQLVKNESKELTEKSK